MFYFVCKLIYTIQYNTTSFISNIEHNNITPTICSQQRFPSKKSRWKSSSSYVQNNRKNKILYQLHFTKTNDRILTINVAEFRADTRGTFAMTNTSTIIYSLHFQRCNSRNSNFCFCQLLHPSMCEAYCRCLYALRGI